MLYSHRENDEEISINIDQIVYIRKFTSEEDFRKSKPYCIYVKLRDTSDSWYFEKQSERDNIYDEIVKLHNNKKEEPMTLNS